MKHIKNLAGSLTLSAAFILAVGYLASLVPETRADESAEPAGQQQAEPQQATEPAGLVVDIDSIRNDQGQVVLLAFDDAEAYANYDYAAAAAFHVTAAAKGLMRIELAELTEGPYAVFIFHDENADNDLNMDGDYPTEGYGTSGAKKWYDESPFDHAAVSEGPVTIHVHYLR